MGSTFFDTTPGLVVFSVLLAVFLISFELGFNIGKWRGPQSKEEKIVGPTVAGMLALLAFIVALSFSMAANRNEQRKQNVLDEANAIATAYLRAHMVNQVQGARISDLLEKYTDLHIHSRDYEDQTTLLDKVQAIQTDLWKEVIALGKTSPGFTTGFLAGALNQVFDLHMKRINDAVYNRFRTPVWIVVISIGALGMVVLGIQGGLSGKRALVGLIPFALALTAMVYLIADLDSPQSGVFIVSQQPMLDTLESMHQFK